MKCIIVDDEPLAREGLKVNINEIPNLELVGEFSNPTSANEFLLNNTVDLMFLDVQMPEMTGTEFLKTLKNPPFVIMSTAYSEYAVEAFEYDVVDYIVKPVKFERFVKAVNKVQEIVKLMNSKSEFEKVADDYIFVKSERKYIKIRFDEIYFIEGLKDYIIIYTTHGKYMTAMNVKTIHNKIPQSIFHRTSKSYVININHLKAIDGHDVIIADSKIPIGRSYRDTFLKFVNNSLLRR